MSDIFISYASEDRPRAEMLAQALEHHGWSTFWDRTIPTGRQWREMIGRQLNESRCVIVLWSKTSIDRAWVQEEADEAQRRGVLVPLLIENVQPPIGFRSIQAAHLENWDGTESTQAFRRLIADISALIGQPPKEVGEEARTEGREERQPPPVQTSPQAPDFEPIVRAWRTSGIFYFCLGATILAFGCGLLLRGLLLLALYEDKSGEFWITMIAGGLFAVASLVLFNWGQKSFERIGILETLRRRWISLAASRGSGPEIGELNRVVIKMLQDNLVRGF